MPAPERPPPPASLTLLSTGEIEVLGRMPWSSNATFLARVCADGSEGQAVYKPHRGERPLWDFPDGLYQREIAAFLVSEALGWRLVPETVLRHDGPYGVGSLQRFVDADFEHHYFTLLEDETNHAALLRIAVFDLIVNNADRKGGHCLVDGDGHVWAIDNGLCFNLGPRLRTVIWDFGGERVPDELRADAGRLATQLPDGLDELLSGAELDSLRARAAAVARLDLLPNPDPQSRPYPWPLV